MSTPELQQFDVNIHVLGDLPCEDTLISLPPTVSVSRLQQAIKAAYRPKFDCLTAGQLKLWKASILCDSIKEGINKLSLDDKEHLKLFDTLSKVFPGPIASKHVHIIINNLPVGECFMYHHKNFFGLLS